VSDTPLLVDPAVSRAKFVREVGRFRDLADHHARNGCWLAKAEFPTAFVVFGTPKIKPPAVAFGAVFDFTNYDLWAPSVRLVDPFTQEPYKAKEVPTPLPRRVPPSPAQAAGGIEAAIQHILQAHGSDDIPFICLPGIREYHAHPAHSGDSWLLHRCGGEGTLHNLVTQLYRYGTEYIVGYRVAISGLAQAEVPT
jgi:hypothetical protein